METCRPFTTSSYKPQTLRLKGNETKDQRSIAVLIPQHLKEMQFFLLTSTNAFSSPIWNGTLNSLFMSKKKNYCIFPLNC